MRTAIVVPTYWSRPSSEGWRQGDLVFDHPTPLDGTDTLGRLLRSLEVLEESDYGLVLVVVPTSAEIAESALRKIRAVVSESSPPVKTALFTIETMERISSIIGQGAENLSPLLSFSGYPHVRNVCLMAARLLDAEKAVLIDDDEFFEDGGFLKKVEEGIKRELDGRPILALAGHYINPNGDFRLNKPPMEWESDWPKYRVLDEAFELFIGKPPRYKRTPFAFGGNMILHRELYASLPFDTGVTRGEDIDYLMMASMHGVPTVLDNELAIRHLAPPKSHPQWQQFRQDAVRFAFQRAKLTAEPVGGMHRKRPEDFDPYPGYFLRNDLFERIEKTARNLAEYYAKLGDDLGAKESLDTVEIARKVGNPTHNPLAEFIELRDKWRHLMELLGDGRFGGLLD
jgi:hypothetical protein